jgi:hypothetical protein
VFLLGVLLEVLARVFGRRLIDREIESADTTAADLLVRFSIAAGGVVFLLWLSFRL